MRLEENAILWITCMINPGSYEGILELSAYTQIKSYTLIWWYFSWVEVELYQEKHADIQAY